MEPLRRGRKPREDPTNLELKNIDRNDHDIDSTYHYSFVDDDDSDLAALTGNNKKASKHLQTYKSTESLDKQGVDPAVHILGKGLPHYLLTWELLLIGLSICSLGMIDL
jgi:hypothetical protein